MKIIVISDTHLHSFEEEKYRYLKKIIASADQVIINGDLWDGYIISFEKFIASPWKSLFPLLKKKKTIYIFGNHDKEKYSDERRKLFCIKTGSQFTLDFGQYSIHLEHGDRLAPKLDARFPFFQRQPFGYISDVYPVFGAWFFGWDYFGIENKSSNDTLKKYAKEHSRKKSVYLFGHTHTPELNLSIGYGNSGIIRWGFASYLVIENDSISLVKERYR